MNKIWYTFCRFCLKIVKSLMNACLCVFPTTVQAKRDECFIPKRLKYYFKVFQLPTTAKRAVKLTVVFLFFLNCVINKKGRALESKWERYTPSPLRSSVRLCEFSGSVITMEYIPLSLSVGSITCELINEAAVYFHLHLFNYWFRKKMHSFAI